MTSFILPLISRGTLLIFNSRAEIFWKIAVLKKFERREVTLFVLVFLSLIFFEQVSDLVLMLLRLPLNKLMAAEYPENIYLLKVRYRDIRTVTVQKMKFSIKDFFS